MLRVRVPQRVMDAFTDSCRRDGVTTSERLRQLVERDIAESTDARPRIFARRLRRIRRCICCGAFVRNGYTCKTCRIALVDVIDIGGNLGPIPFLPRPDLPLRPDVRDGRWPDAEAVVLDAFAPVVAIVYEAITGESSFETTDLDDIADLLAMAASLRD